MDLWKTDWKTPTLNPFKMTLNVKVCLVMDCTASMGQWIRQAKTKMVELVDRVREEHPNTTIRVGFVGYRDYGDKERLIEIPFQDAQDTMLHIQPIEPEGGDDVTEDVATGLFRVMHMDWNGADVKIVFHIADAPAHGDAFHAPKVSDRYPRGDPNGLDPRDSVEKMSFLDIHYTFVKINDSTDTMIEQFHNCYTQGGSFTVMDLSPQCWTNVLAGDPINFSDALTRSITHSITQHYTSSQVP